MKIKNITKKFSLECETAASPWKQAAGLSFSNKRRNMLFIFPLKRRWEFWMFAMLYPLRIVFIDDGKRVVDIQEAEPLSFNPKTWKVYVPKRKCRYALEVPAERRYRFSKGDKLEW